MKLSALPVSPTTSARGGRGSASAAPIPSRACSEFNRPSLRTQTAAGKTGSSGGDDTAAPIPLASERHKRPPAHDRSGVTGGGGEFSPRHRRSSDFQTVTEINSHHGDASSDTNITLEKPMSSNAKNVLNSPVTELSRRPFNRRRVTENALRYIAREAVSDAPAKIVAREADISVREVQHLRTATVNPRLGVWYELLRRRPDLKPHVERITSGEATPEEISKLIAFFQRGSG